MSEYTNPFGVSFIQTAGGAVITGEIKRYPTYKAMCADTNIAATRLASVTNASHDEDYDVPADHVGGVLYQRDTISNTWVLLYSERDLSVPTYVNWDRILDIPKWVGGITHNRVKLTQNMFAELRTTYYSFGPYNLIMPRPDEKKIVHGEEVYSFDLGEEIVLEQYDNVGAILIPYNSEINDILTETAEIRTINGNQYQVIFTYAPSSYRLEGEDTIRATKHAYSFRLICTEDDNGKRYWTLCTTNDEAVNAIIELRKEQTNHILAQDPHNQYIKKIDLRHYFIPATTTNSGTVVLAIRQDIDVNNDTSVVTPYLLKNYVNEVITYKCNLLDNVITKHINNSDIHFNPDYRDQINKHMEDALMHVSPDDRLRWNSAVSNNDGPSSSEEVAAHNASTDAHADLFDSKVNVEDFEDYKRIVNNTFNTKQQKLAESTFIKLVPTSDQSSIVVNCTLHANPGSGITIGTDGAISCDAAEPIPDASVDGKGIVQLVETITEENENSNALAVTPAAIKKLSKIVNSLFVTNKPNVTCTRTAVAQANPTDGHNVYVASWTENSKDPSVNITTKFLLPRIALANADYIGTYSASDIYIGMWTATGTRATWDRRRVLRNLRVYYNTTQNAYYFSMDVIKASDGTLEKQINAPIPVDGTKYTILSKEEPGKSHDTTKISMTIWMDTSYVYIQGYVSAYGEEKDHASVVVRYDPNVTWTWTPNE